MYYRGNSRATIFRTDRDYMAFEKIMAEAQQRLNIRLLGYCLMPNHWHLLLWPYGDGDLSEFMRWLTVTHTTRWHTAHNTTGAGHLYQGRFKSFPVKNDAYYYTAMRYVERNPLVAKLVDRPEAWPWSSLPLRLGLTSKPFELGGGPIVLPVDWLKMVNQPLTPKEQAAFQNAIARSRPFGNEQWVAKTSDALNLQSTLNPRGRPKLSEKGT